MTPPQTVGSTLCAVSAALLEAGFDEPRRRARRLIASALDVPVSDVFAHLDRTISRGDGERIGNVLRRVLAHEPLSRVFGVREFWGLDFALSPETLDPRPDSETIIEAVLARLPERQRAWRILDLGTGSGCLLLALLSEFPAAAGIGVDRVSGAAAAAMRNAARLGLADRASFIVADWGAALADRFDIVVANPPYIASAAIASLPREVRDFDPRRALDGGSDGLDAYRAITAGLPPLLANGGIFAGEIGHGQDRAVAALIAASGLAIDAIVPDLAGIPRCVVARRLE